MRLASICVLSAALAGSLVVAGPVEAQSWHNGPVYGGGYNTGYGQPYRPAPRRHYGYDRSFNGQADVPGDYRCDAYWDANRDDCHARWRDQRGRSSYGRNYGYRTSYGYGGWNRGRGYGYGGPGYGAGQAYYGAYGRPDLVYPGGGYGHGYSGGYGGGYAAGPRDPARSQWCAWRFRSYDPGSGYYRAYSGRLVYCG